jgi:hypothetical protein
MAMSDDLVDSILDKTGEALSYAIDDGLGGFGVLLGFTALRCVIGAARNKSTPAGYRSGPDPVVEVLNNYVKRGQFDEAEEFLDQSYLPLSVKADYRQQLRNIRFAYASQQARLQEWNATINYHLNRRDSAAAVRFVESLNLTRMEKDEAIKNIREQVRQREQREGWNRKLNALVSQGQFRKARRFVKSLPLDRQEKDEILALLPDVPSPLSRFGRWIQLGLFRFAGLMP